MGKSFVRIIQIVALAAAVLGLLLTTPSIEAATTHKTRKKKVKITFSQNEAPADQGELGDEIVQPRMVDHGRGAQKKSVVHLRGNSVDDIWDKSSTKKTAKAVQPEENPDLMEPIGGPSIDEPAHAHASDTRIADDLAVDESALGSFKASPRKSAVAPAPKRAVVTKLTTQSVAKSVAKAAEKPVAKSLPAKRVAVAAAPAPEPQPQPIVRATPQPAMRSTPEPRPIARATPPQTVRPLPEPILDFDEVKPAPRRVVHSPAAPAAPQSSKIYWRNTQPVAHASTSVAAAEPSEFKFVGGFDNTFTMGRKYELETPGGENFLMKNELTAGAMHSSGWGAKVAINYLTESADDATKNVHEMGDPSIALVHPDLYRSQDIRIGGEGRYYMPVAATSRSVGLQQFAYFLRADFALVDQMSVNNTFIPHYFYQQRYADADAFSLLEDSTEFAKTFDSIKIGVGQLTQIESHQATPAGEGVQVYPFAEFVGIKDVVFAARLYLPLFVKGIVNGAPGEPGGLDSTQGFSNMQAQFGARVSF